MISVVKSIGGFTIQENVSDMTTHLVSGDPRRTINLLLAIARGCWVVHKEWVGFCDFISSPGLWPMWAYVVAMGRAVSGVRCPV